MARRSAYDETGQSGTSTTAVSSRRKRLLRLGLTILLMQGLFWGLFSAPWGPRPQLGAIDRIEFRRAELAELKAPTPAAADAAPHEKINLPYTDCCDPAYLSLRTFFDLDEAPSGGLGMVAYQQVDNFIIRVNGSLVHQVGEMEFGRQTFHGQRPYLLHLPAGLLKAGENEISFITVRQGFPYTDLIAPLLGAHEQVREATALRFWQSLDYRLLGGGLTFILGLFAAIMVFRSQDRRFAAWLMMLCWSWTAFAAYGLVFDLPFGGTGRMAAFFAINTLIASSLLCFIDAWTRRPALWGQTAVELIWLLFNAAVLVCLYAMPMPDGFDLASEGWSWFSLIAGVMVVARLVWHFATVAEDRHLEAALLSVCAVCLALDGVGEKFGLLAGGYLIDAAPLLLLAFVAAFVQRNFTLFRSAVGLNAMLETRLRAREIELAQAHERERELIDREARSEERRRLMRDMHDGVGGQLVGLLLSVRRGAVDNERVAESLQGVMDEIRLMIDSADTAGASLDAMLAVFETRVRPRVQDAGFDFGWRVERTGTADLAPQDVLQVFRIMQEAVTNAMKHSGGDRIDIVVSDHVDGELRVRISDNGKGTDAAANDASQTRGHGLGNMRSRATALGARLAFLDEQPGTAVVLDVPIAMEARQAA